MYAGLMATLAGTTIASAQKPPQPTLVPQVASARLSPAVPRNHKLSGRQSPQQQRSGPVEQQKRQATSSASGLVVQITNFGNYTPDATASSIAIQATSDPVGAARAADAMQFIAGNNTAGYIGQNIISGDSDEGNGYAWTQSFPFVANANANGSPDDGWQGLPALDGFTLNRSIEIRGGAIQPAYITANYQPANIKRGIIVFPGKPRDSWKYTNLVRNALTVQAGLFPEWGVSPDSVVIVGPAWLNNNDQTAGAVQGNELVFHGTQWQSGGNSKAPTSLNSSITSYEAVDKFMDILFDKAQFPNLNQVVVVGHSMGGQMVQRYALLKKTKKYDQNVRFWAGNPGSYAWLTDDRPYQNASCTNNMTAWHYGIGGNQTKVSKYARKDVLANRQAVVDRYLARKFHLALGLLDNGAGDTHCQARVQGGNHLDRGSQFALQLNSIPQPNAWPANFTLDYMVGVSHQDYAMLSSNSSLQRIFYEDYNVRYPDLTNTTNPGDELHPLAKQKSFATPLHKIVAYALLFGSIGGICLAFAIMPFLFSNNLPLSQQVYWEKAEASMR